LIGRTATPTPQQPIGGPPPPAECMESTHRASHASKDSTVARSAPSATPALSMAATKRRREQTRGGLVPARHSQEAEGGENHVASPDIDALKACKCR